MGKKNQPGCPCCPGSYVICALLIDCSSVPQSGYAVSVKTYPSGVVVGTATTGADGRGCVTVPGAGTYTVTVTIGGVDYVQTVTIAAPGTVTATFTKPGPSGLCLAVIVCGNKVSATVTVAGWTQYSSTASVYCFAPNSGATVTAPFVATVTWIDPIFGTFGPTTFSVPMSGVCDSPYHAIDVTQPYIKVFVKGCNANPLPGASVTAPDASCTTDSTGHCTLTYLPNQPVGTVVTTHSRMTTVTSASPGNYGCTGLTVAMSIADPTNYTCFDPGTVPCPIPYKKSFLATLACGSLTLTWQGSNSWAGCMDVANPSPCPTFCGGPTTKVPITLSAQLIAGVWYWVLGTQVSYVYRTPDAGCQCVWAGDTCATLVAFRCATSIGTASVTCQAIDCLVPLTITGSFPASVSCPESGGSVALPAAGGFTVTESP